MYYCVKKAKNMGTAYHGTLYCFSTNSARRVHMDRDTRMEPVDCKEAKEASYLVDGIVTIGESPLPKFLNEGPNRDRWQMDRRWVGGYDPVTGFTMQGYVRRPSHMTFLHSA